MSTENTWTYPNTNGWAEYPFTVDNVEFVSKIQPNSSISTQLMFVPAEVFTQMNISAVREMIGAIKFMSREEIIARLEEVNQNASSAVIEIV